jgi:hypothetical protein
MGLSGDTGKQKALLLVECLQLTVTDWPMCGPYTVPQCIMFNIYSLGVGRENILTENLDVET